MVMSYYDRHREERLKYAKEYHEKHREEINKRHKEHCKNKRTYFRDYAREYRKKYPERIKANLEKKRKEIFRLLGNKCANPFNLNHGDLLSDKRCLQIDHIKGDGYVRRKGLSYSKYLRIILEEIKSGSKDYQLLCANCNWIKRYEKREFFEETKQRFP